MNAEVLQILERIQSFYILEIDIPKPHSFYPWKLGKEVKI